MYLGIDLGTSNSAVVGHDGNNHRVFKTSEGTDVLPSVIYLGKRGNRLIGNKAYNYLLSAPQNVAHGFKRLMGTINPILIAGETWTPVECSAEIIKTLVNQAMIESGGQEIEGVVITTPAAFNQMQSEDTISAARLAGLEKVSLLQEPVAAALAAISNSNQKDGTFLVYDLGGGTFDLALVESTAGVVNIIAHEGINMLGGRDFDRIIFDSVIRPWISENFDLPINFQSNEKYKYLSNVSKYSAEAAKIQLSTLDTSTISVEDEINITDEQGEEIYIAIDLSRKKMNELIHDKIEETINLCRKIISENGYKIEDISKIVPIGGPSKMPIIPEMLQTELVINVHKGLDPMTAVATGAAIFAESRVWNGEKSIQKATKHKETITGDITLSLDFKSRVTTDNTKIRIKPADDIPSGTELEILDEEGTTSGRISLNGPLSVNVKVRKAGKNRYIINVFNSTGRKIESASREISIIRAEASVANIPMTYNLAVKIQHGMAGHEHNKLEILVKKGVPLPAEGRHIFRSGKTITGDIDDSIVVDFYQMTDGLDSPEHNLYIGNFRLESLKELDQDERINRGDEFIIVWQMSDNMKLTFSVEIPALGRIIPGSDFYHPEDGGINYEGKQGAEVAATMLSHVESDFEDLENALDQDPDPSGDIQKRIEKLHALLSTSVDAESNRSVVEEARKLRQDVALLKISPENEKRVLEDECAKSEILFDQIRENAQPVDAERYDKLLATARRSINENNFDNTRKSLEQMREIQGKVIAESPNFLIDMFQHLANKRHMTIDEDMHNEHVITGTRAAKSGDMDRLRSIVDKMIKNQVSTDTDTANVMKLAHLLGS